MVKYEDECCGCATESYPCLGSSCKNRNVPRFYCDECEVEDILYEFENLQLCQDCLISKFNIVEGSDF